MQELRAEPDSVTFVVSVNNAAMGTTNPAPGTYRYAVGDNASIEAMPNDGYHFVCWTVSILGVNDTLYEPVYEAQLPAELAGLTVSVRAVFAPGDQVFTVNAYADDTTMGRVTGSGEYVDGDEVTVTAEKTRFLGRHTNSRLSRIREIETFAKVLVIEAAR